MALSNPFNPPPNTPLLPDPTRDSVWRRWFEQLWRRIQTGALGGDVVGPASSTDNAVARWDGATGKLLQNSGVIISDTNTVTIPSLTSGRVVYVSTGGLLADSTYFTWNSSSNIHQLGAATVPGTYTVGPYSAMTISGVAMAIPSYAANSNIQGNVELHSYTSATPGAGAFFYGVRTRGTISAPTAVASGDNLLTIGGAGYDGTNYTWGAHIHFLADGAPSAGVLPGALDFQTTPAASNTPTSRLKLDKAGGYTVNGSIGTSGQVLTSGGAGGAASWTSPATGTVTSIDVSGGTTGLTFSGGPVTTSGTITMAGTLDVDNGGTGQASYTNGQLLIGNTTGNTLTKATLTQGSGITITNGTGSITIAAVNNGDVVGPASATDNAAVRFDSTTGKLIQNSALIIADTTGSLSRSGDGGIPVQGTNTNDDAAAGYVGEYIESIIAVGSAVSLTSGVVANVTSISLTAGDWDVSGQVALLCGASTSITRGAGGISDASATLQDPYRATLAGAAFVPGAVVPYAFALPRRRVSIASTTTIYLVGFATFTVSTCTAFGGINARRVR